MKNKTKKFKIIKKFFFTLKLSEKKTVALQKIFI